jgi:hypothetical protein
MQKKIAKEILILFGLIGLTLFVVLSVWCYSMMIKTRIESKNKIIFKKEITLNKFEKIEQFITLVKLKDEEHWVSHYGIFLLSKECKVDNAIRKFENEQTINGNLPNPQDTIAYMDCIKLTRKYLIKPEILPVWNCLLKNKENLFYFLPLPVLENYKITTREDLFNFIEQLNINSEEQKNIEVSELRIQITRLKKEVDDLQNNPIIKNGVVKIMKITCIIFFFIAYPLRLLLFVFIWALKTYRQT